MTFNFEKIGEPIAFIKNDDNKAREKIIYINTDKKKKAKNEFKKLELDEESGDYMQQYPNINHRIGYITGASGAGKSTYILKFAKEYQNLNKKNNIFVFSALKKDETLDKLKTLKRIQLNDNFLETPLDIEDFHESLTLFDDVDNIHNNAIKEEVYKIVHSIAETGRHEKVMCILSNHLPSNRMRTRQVLNECSYFVYYPNYSKPKINYVLEEYVGMDKNFHKKMKKKDSRWCCIFTFAPTVVLLEKEIFVYEENDD